MTTEYELCPHGRHVGAVCLPCAEKEIVDETPEIGPYIECAGYNECEEYVDPFDTFGPPVEEKPSDRQVNGDHYKSMAIQPSEFIYRNGLDWYEGNAVKYICRHRRKGGRVDVEKAIHYLELLLEQEYVKSVDKRG